MARHAPNGYDIRRSSDGALLSRHRTRRAAVEQWRLQHSGVAVQIVRVYDSGQEVLVVEGTWHARDAIEPTDG